MPPEHTKDRSGRREFLKAAGGVSTVALAGCTGGNDTTNTGSTGEDGWTHGKSIHYIGPPLDSVWWRTMAIGHAIVAHQRGWDFSFTTPGWDAAAVSDEILVQAQRNDALIVNPVAYEAHVSTIERVKSEFGVPVVGNKDLVGGAVSHNIQSDDYSLAEVMVEKAMAFIEDSRGSLGGSTLVHFQGNPDFTGWRRRIEQVRESMKEYPEVEYVEIATNGTVADWADAAQTYFSNNDADAVVSDSSGAFTRGIMDALAANDKLYYVGDDNHVFVGGIDGYPSATHYVRRGLQDLDMPQVPYNITINIANIFHDQILQPDLIANGEIPTAEVGTTIEQITEPFEIYMGPGSVELEMSEYGVPIASLPPNPLPVTIDNVNDYNIWGNAHVGLVERTDLMDVEFDVQGEPPAEVEELTAQFESKLSNGDFGERLEYLQDYGLME